MLAVSLLALRGIRSCAETGSKVKWSDVRGELALRGESADVLEPPQTFSDIAPDSLSIFQTVRPIPEILILGCGRHMQPVDPDLRCFIRSTGMKLEALDSLFVEKS
ncbi:hypothetical protein NL676_012081 [Syzygium grande]|nr:hypothetical protein NL676_012081 [Syzygium grande]